MYVIEGRKRTVVAYIALFAVQIVGAAFFVWIELPAFRQVLLNPGEQLQFLPYHDLTMVCTLLVMQSAYWYRVLRIPVPFRNSNLIVSHLFLFLGRLSFIFGAAMFSVVVFRHLPELDRSADIPLLLRRGIVFMCELFTLFCATLELERLGQAFGNDHRD